MKFNPDKDFEDNLNIALSELDDVEIADIVRKRFKEIILLAGSCSSSSRAPIINNFEELIKQRMMR